MKGVDARQWHPQQHPHPHPHRKLSNLAPRSWRPHHGALHDAEPHRGERLVEATIAELLRLLKEHFRMDVVFVARQPDESPLDALPADARASAPIRLASGDLHGTLYCINMPGSGDAMGEREFRRLEMSARLAARLIDGVEVHMASSLG